MHGVIVANLNISRDSMEVVYIYLKVHKVHFSLNVLLFHSTIKTLMDEKMVLGSLENYIVYYVK